MSLKRWLSRKGGPGKATRAVTDAYSIVSEKYGTNDEILRAVEEHCSLPKFVAANLTLVAISMNTHATGVSSASMSTNDYDVLCTVIAKELREAGVPDSLSGADMYVDGSIYK